jgi:hypothetical protein
MQTRILSSVMLLLATSLPTAGQTQGTTVAAAGDSECPDQSGWNATTWPVLVAEDGRHLILKPSNRAAWRLFKLVERA